MLVDSKPQIQQQKRRTQYSVPRWGRVEFFSKLHEVFIKLGFSFSSEPESSFVVWLIDSVKDTKLSELPSVGTVLSSVPSNNVLSGSCP